MARNSSLDDEAVSPHHNVYEPIHKFVFNLLSYRAEIMFGIPADGQKRRSLKRILVNVSHRMLSTL